jgi:predicted phosphodiesterase
VKLYGELFKMKIAGKQFAMNHYPEIARELAASQHFDVVCYGHDHQFYNDFVGKTLLISPGTLMGYNPITKNNVDVTYGIYDTDTSQFEIERI